MDELLEFMAPLLGKDAGELSEAIKKDDDGNFELKEAKEIIRNALKERLSAVEREARDEGYGRAKREVLSGKEKELAEKHGIKNYSDLEDLFAKAIKENSKDGEKITPEKIRESETYQNDIKALKEAEQNLQSEFESFKKEVFQKETDSKLNQKLKALIQSEGYQLPEDERRRQVLFDAYKSHLSKGKQFVIEGDQVQMLNEDGKPVKDELHNLVSFDDTAKEIADVFFEKGDAGNGKQSPGAGQNPPNPGTTPDDLPVINNANDFYTKLPDVPADKRAAFKEKFQKFQEAQK